MIDIIANFCKKKSIFVIFFIVLITVNPSEEKKKTLLKTEFVHAMIVKNALNQWAHETLIGQYGTLLWPTNCRSTPPPPPKYCI